MLAAASILAVTLSSPRALPDVGLEPGVSARDPKPAGDYIGGVSQAVLQASPPELDALFADVAGYPRLLPDTLDARLVQREPDGFLAWVRQGNSLFHASYTVRVRASIGPNGERVLRFQLDPSRPHGIRDATGYVRYQALAPLADGKPRVLLTCGTWVDIGPGIVRALFGGTIQRVILSVPQKVRGYVEQHPRA
jgi:hypothetical protein